MSQEQCLCRQRSIQGAPAGTWNKTVLLLFVQYQIANLRHLGLVCRPQCNHVGDNNDWAKRTSLIGVVWCAEMRAASSLVERCLREWGEHGIQRSCMAWIHIQNKTEQGETWIQGWLLQLDLSQEHLWSHTLTAGSSRLANCLLAGLDLLTWTRAHTSELQIWMAPCQVLVCPPNSRHPATKSLGVSIISETDHTSCTLQPDYKLTARDRNKDK